MFQEIHVKYKPNYLLFDLFLYSKVFDVKKARKLMKKSKKNDQEKAKKSGERSKY